MFLPNGNKHRLHQNLWKTTSKLFIGKFISLSPPLEDFSKYFIQLFKLRHKGSRKEHKVEEKNKKIQV